jgi:hypothetical protein
MLLGGDRADQPLKLTTSSTMVEFPHHRCGFSTIVGHGAIVATQTSRVVDVCA